MRRIILSLSAVVALLIVFTIFSCERTITPDDNTAGDADGNLRVSVFEIEKTPFASLTRASEPASAVVTRLNFAIYDQAGTRLKLVSQTADMADF